MDEALAEHLCPLLADDRHFGSSRNEPVFHREGPKGAAGGAGGRVFADVEHVRSEQPAVESVVAKRREQKHGFSEDAGQSLLFRDRSVDGTPISECDIGEGHASTGHLDGDFSIQVVFIEPQRRCRLGPIRSDIAETHRWVGHPEGQAVRPPHTPHSHRADSLLEVELERTTGHPPFIEQDPGCSNCGMAREWHLGGWVEDSHPRRVVCIPRGEDEGRL